MKYIKIKKRRRPNGTPKTLVSFSIEDQTHFCRNFGVASDEFLASNGIILKSISHPQWYDEHRTLYVRGSTSRKNNDCLCARQSDFEAITQAINEYNTKFARKPKVILPENMFEI